jgi:hypothetical protein
MIGGRLMRPAFGSRPQATRFSNLLSRKDTKVLLVSRKRDASTSYTNFTLHTSEVGMPVSYNKSGLKLGEKRQQGVGVVKRCDRCVVFVDRSSTRPF